MNERTHQLDAKDSSFLPKNWIWTTLGEIGTVASGGTPSTKEPSNFDGEIPWVTPADLSGYTGKFIGRGRRNLTKRGLDHSSAELLPAGAVLFSSRAPVGYVAIASNPLATNQGFKNLILQDWISPEYIYYYLRASKELAERFASGTTFLEVSGSRFARIPIPLCPTPEQCRIVAKVEELFTKLDAGVKSLQTVKVQLKRYRQSVLKSAFEGKLTEVWRRTHRDELEPASKMLERIKEERRKRWGERLGKSRDSKTSKYKETEEANTQALPDLPKSWTWASMDEASEYIVDCPHSTPRFQESGKYCIDTTCIGPAHIFLERARRVSERVFLERTRRQLPKCGDVLFSREGTIGIAVLVPPNTDLCLGQRMMMFRPWNNIDSAYFMWALNSRVTRIQLDPLVTGTTSPHVNVRDIKRLRLPLPPSLEQKLIATKLNELFVQADLIEGNVTAAMKSAQVLRQSILKQAFSGKLVPQDKNDEPASILLERIESLKTQIEEDRKMTRTLRRKDSKQNKVM